MSTSARRRTAASSGTKALVLIKHAEPRIEAGVPAAAWRLSPAGRHSATLLGSRLKRYALSCIVSSVEPKAQETAQLFAAEVGVPWRSAPDLHEHDRRDVPFLEAPQFRETVARFFNEPDRLIFGGETAAQALRRFTVAVVAALAEAPEGDVAVVTHGTVMTLYVAATTGLEPYSLWLRLGLPSFIALTWPERQLLEVVDTIEP